ncbi:MAG: hypothetical protein WKG07_20745, partial [Hymenobacter sp.]
MNTFGGADLARVLGNEPTQIDRGNQILGDIFQVEGRQSRVADNAAQSSGLAPELLEKQMLPILVMLVAGHLTGRSA